MKKLKEKVEVMQAALDGEDIEYRNKSRDTSWDIMPNPEFDSWDRGDYRIKPKPIQWWSNMYGGILEPIRYATKQTAIEAAGDDVQDTILMRQVLE